MTNVHTNAIDIRCDIAGEGPWLILLHSLATDLTLWDDQMAALTAHFRVLRFDTRGHGSSSAPQGPYDFAMLTTDVLGLMDALKIERAHIVGISLGGMIAQHVALAAPQRVDRLVLVSTTSGYPPEARTLWAERIAAIRANGIEPLVSSTLERWFTRPFQEAHAETMDRIAALIRTTPVAGYIGSGQAIATLDTTDKLPALRCPTLVVVGADDTGTPPAMGRRIAEQIPGARLESIGSASHLCNIEQAVEFNRRLIGFLLASALRH
jgi:3-oxoadipate enol-lactonase